MRWVDNLMLDEGDRIRCVVQYGSSLTPPSGAECFDYLDHDVLLDLMNSARAVVSSGGPSTLLEARRLGHRPIVVPRWTSLGEHVDDHQRAFAGRLHDAGIAVRAETETEFRVALSVALDAPRVVVTATEDRPAIARVGALIDGVAAHAMGRL
jgi:UDP-N-acetylglucosamine transferase subunit ALG13